MYTNYTAMIQEAIEFRASVDVSVVESRYGEIIEDRIGLIARALNISASAFEGRIENSGSSRRQLSAGRRRLNTLNTSSCTDLGPVFLLTLVFETDSLSERDRVTRWVYDNADSLGDLFNATGLGDNATVCIPATVTSIDRNVENAPPPPPRTSVRETLEVSRETLIIAACIVGALAVCLCCCCCVYCFCLGAADDDDSDEEEEKEERELYLRYPRVARKRGGKRPITTTQTDVAWKPIRMGPV